MITLFDKLFRYSDEKEISTDFPGNVVSYFWGKIFLKQNWIYISQHILIWIFIPPLLKIEYLSLKILKS
jgi:hypothetical protein